MPSKTLRKTPLVVELEERYGKPIERIVTQAINEHGSLEASAASLGVNVNTFYYWVIRLGIQVRKVAIVA